LCLLVHSERQQGVKQYVMKLVARTAELQCQLADYQATVSSLTERLDDVSAQLKDSQQNLSHSGKHWAYLIHTAALRYMQSTQSFDNILACASFDTRLSYV